MYIVLWPPPPASCPIPSAPIHLHDNMPRHIKFRQPARRPTLLCLWRCREPASGLCWGGTMVATLSCRRLPACLREWIQAHGLGCGVHAVGVATAELVKKTLCSANLLSRVCLQSYIIPSPLNVSSSRPRYKMCRPCVGFLGSAGQRGADGDFPPSSMGHYLQVSQLSWCVSFQLLFHMYRFIIKPKGL